MPAPILPTDEEIDRIVVRPGSLLWERFGDARLFMASGYALLLQVAHPTVGAGVKEHSNFLEDPWGRLLRTLDYLNMMVYGGRDAAGVGRRIREMHKQIKGTNADGSHYHALEPEAYAWVHATLLEGAIAAHERFIGKLSDAEKQRFLDEYMPLGRLLGIRERDLPKDLAGFHRYFDEMVHTRLERTASVEDVIRALDHAPPPAAGPEVDRALLATAALPAGEGPPSLYLRSDADPPADQARGLLVADRGGGAARARRRRPRRRPADAAQPQADGTPVPALAPRADRPRAARFVCRPGPRPGSRRSLIRWHEPRRSPPARRLRSPSTPRSGHPRMPRASESSTRHSTSPAGSGSRT